MGIEIERKFLVVGDAWKTNNAVRYSQGYLNSHHARTVRVRIGGHKAFLTVKGPSQGATRAEFEYPIALDDAEQIMELCETVVEKYRHLVHHAGMVWEVDEFQGNNLGLVVAEIELKSEDQQFELPDWVGREVTDDPRYFNSRLAQTPWTTWPEKHNSAAP